MLKLDNLKIDQGGFSIEADAEFHQGITAVIGPSGGGKSTLLLSIAGFAEPSHGAIILNDKDITDDLPSKRSVTLLFQENNLFPHLDVFQNAALGIKPSLKLNGGDTEKVHAALSQVGLNGFGKRLPSELSGGQRQRVALARALMRDKPVLMLDEPFAALGPALRHEMLDLVAEIQARQNAIVLLVTHNPDDARRIAGNTVLVAGGRAHSPVPTMELLDNPPEALADYLGA